MMMGGLANFVIPLITGYLSNIGLQYIIVLDFTFALLALITAIIVFIRYYRVFIIPENDVRFGEHKFSTRLNTIKHRVKGVNYGCYRKIRIDWVDGLSHPPQFIARNAE